MLGGQKKSSTVDVDKGALFNYFHNLLSSMNLTTCYQEVEELEEQNHIDENMSSVISDSLNCKITLEEELDAIIGKLKTEKASGSDLIFVKFLKALNEPFLIVFTKLFNKIFDHQEFPAK